MNVFDALVRDVHSRQSTGAKRPSAPSAVPPKALDVHKVVDFRLGDFLVQPALNLVTRHGTVTHLRPQLMDLLVCLAASPGRVFGKDELLTTVWGGRFIADSGLSRCMTELRRALGDRAHQPSIIETIPKRGYRLVAPVASVSWPDRRCERGATQPASNTSSDRAGEPRDAIVAQPAGTRRLRWLRSVLSRLSMALRSCGRCRRAGRERPPCSNVGRPIPPADTVALAAPGAAVPAASP